MAVDVIIQRDVFRYDVYEYMLLTPAIAGIMPMLLAARDLRPSKAAQRAR